MINIKKPPSAVFKTIWCRGVESNYRHKAFQASALPLSYPGDSHYSIDTRKNANEN